MNWHWTRNLLPGIALLTSMVVRAAEPAGTGSAINGFRGPNGNGVWNLPEVSVPENGTSSLWRYSPKGFGWAAPVTGGGKVFLLAADAPKISKPSDFTKGTREMGLGSYLGTTKPPKEVHTWTVTALDGETGKSLWVAELHKSAPQIPHHPSNTYATETPATNGKVVCCWAGSCGQLVCLAADTGKEIWRQDLGVEPRATGFGSGSSPVIDSDRVFIQCDNEKKSFVAAFSLATGKELWRQPRKVKTSWSTPFIWKNSKRTELVLCGDGLLTGLDPNSGDELWRYTALKGGFATSPASEGDLLIACKSDPFNPGQYVAVRAGYNGDLTPKSKEEESRGIAWSKKEKGPGLASPVLAKGRLFVSSDQFITCMESSTGKQLWKERLPGAKSVAASVWALGNSICVLDESGKLFQIANEPEYKLMAKSDFGDLHWSTPDLASGKLVLRGVNEVVCLPLKPQGKP